MPWLRSLAHDVIGKKAQAAAGCHLRVQLPQAACRRVTRIGELALASLRSSLVELHKGVSRHIDLATHI